jgi:RNA polymerase sigma-70 factor (ECF subfamily)
VEDDLDNGLVDAYNQEMVQEAMRLLTVEQQQVVHMRFIEGYNLQQSADALGKSVGAVKVMQHRALEALSRAFSKQGIVYEA